MRARVLVRGKVQGVFFRDSTRAIATELGVVGFVRNLRDGRVEAQFEGPSRAVEECIAFCRRGPPAARVGSVEVSWIPRRETESTFEIRPSAAAPEEVV